jgi:hypothetical protein
MGVPIELAAVAAQSLNTCVGLLDAQSMRIHGMFFASKSKVLCQVFPICDDFGREHCQVVRVGEYETIRVSSVVVERQIFVGLAMNRV